MGWFDRPQKDKDAEAAADLAASARLDVKAAKVAHRLGMDGVARHFARAVDDSLAEIDRLNGGGR